MCTHYTYLQLAGLLLFFQISHIHSVYEMTHYAWIPRTRLECGTAVYMKYYAGPWYYVENLKSP